MACWCWAPPPPPCIIDTDMECREWREGPTTAINWPTGPSCWAGFPSLPQNHVDSHAGTRTLTRTSTLISHALPLMARGGTLTTIAACSEGKQIKIGFKNKIKKLQKLAVRATFAEMYWTGTQRVRRRINPVLMVALLLVVLIMLQRGYVCPRFTSRFASRARYGT